MKGANGLVVSPTLSILFGELVLSLYPILIKTVNTNIFTQILARFIVFPILAIAFGSTYDFQSIWSTPHEIFVGILGGILNIVHIAVSYNAFKILPVGTSISLFYLYPLFNIIAGALFFGEPLSFFSIILIIVSFVGAYLIATSYKKQENNENKTAHDYDTYKMGVGLGIMAALTETMIFMFVRSNADTKHSPFYTVTHLYPMGLLLLGLYGLTNKNIVDFSAINWTKLIGFNALLGFTGYIARFYAIPNVPVLFFSLLSFFGVSFGYLWGMLFTKDEPTVKAMIGSGLIVSSIALLRYFESD